MFTARHGFHSSNDAQAVVYYTVMFRSRSRVAMSTPFIIHSQGHVRIRSAHARFKLWHLASLSLRMVNFPFFHTVGPFESWH